MISRRRFWGIAGGLCCAGRMRGQEAQRPVELKIAVMDRTHYITGLTARDFRVFEDGIRQKIVTFAEGTNPPVRVEDRTATLDDDKRARRGEQLGSILDDLKNGYTITYYPDPANTNQGFRKFHIEIVPDGDRSWRVRHRPGYRASVATSGDAAR